LFDEASRDVYFQVHRRHRGFNLENLPKTEMRIHCKLFPQENQMIINCKYKFEKIAHRSHGINVSTFRGCKPTQSVLRKVEVKPLEIRNSTKGILSVPCSELGGQVTQEFVQG